MLKMQLSKNYNFSGGNIYVGNDSNLENGAGRD